MLMFSVILERCDVILSVYISTFEFSKSHTYRLNFYAPTFSNSAEFAEVF